MKIDINSDYYMWSSLDFNYSSLITEIIDITLDKIGLRKWGLNKSIAILLSDDNRLRYLNEKYRNEDNPTNILSFPYISASEILPETALISDFQSSSDKDNNDDDSIGKNGGSKNDSDNKNDADNKNNEKNLINNEKFEDRYIGDIFISYDRIEDESLKLGKSFKEHLMHIVIHGVLHILGYTHDDEDNAVVMRKIETEVMAICGYDDPYNPKNDM